MQVGFGMLKIAKRGKATNGGSPECNDAWVARFSTHVFILKLWAQFVVLCLPSFRCSTSGICLWDLGRGMGADYRHPGRVINTGLVSSAHACLLLLHPSSRG